MAKFLEKILGGSKADKDMKAIAPYVDKIHTEYEHIKTLSNDELRAKTIEFRNIIKEAVKDEEAKVAEMKEKLDTEYDMPIDEKQEMYAEIDKLENSIYDTTQNILDDILPAAFAVVKDTARRFKENEEVVVTATEMDKDIAAKHDHVSIKGSDAIWLNNWMAGGNRITWDMVHYNVQLIGGVALHEGKIAEMATGEGKTLVATLPVYLNALSGKGVHVVTVNDYLAKRDAEWMGGLFEFHGLKVDCIDKHQPNSAERINAYKADITYGTNNEFGFDYLRDNMARSVEEMVQRGHNYAIVDEVDSVLIDDARTPLIISGPTAKGDLQEFDALKPFVVKLFSAQKSLTNKFLTEAKSILSKDGLTNNEEKKGGLALLRCHRGYPKNKALIKFLSEPGMKTLMRKVENTYMAENMKNMHIVDDELYYVIEEKNNTIELTDKGIDLLTQHTGDAKFFIMPDIGAEVADLEKSDMDEQKKIEKKQEIIQDYSIKSERVHTMNQLLKAYTMFEKDVEYVIMDNKIKIVDEQTGRIMEGRRYSDGLHQAIEAKENVKVEAATQTYATITLQNYFRMYSKLAGMTGTAETEAGELWDIYKLDVVVIPTNRPIARNDYNDLIYKTKKEKFNAVIEEIVKLVNDGRPVLVGTTSVETSELLSRMLKMQKIKHNVLNAKLHAKEADVVAQAGFAGAVTIATNMAGRGTDIKLGPGVKEAGGLAIIGTERHESRRVDRQLRGRSGRQGDPGSSQFFVSLEDDLMRLFGSDRIAGIMDRIGMKDGEVIQHNMITKAIERAQKKVEENNFGIRKRLLEYDDVMNSQREVIYKKRRNALYGDKLEIDLADMFTDISNSLVNDYQESREYELFLLEVLKTFAFQYEYSETDFYADRSDKIADDLGEKAYNVYLEKCSHVASSTYPVIKEIFENDSRKYENVAVPFTDGKKTLQALANIKKSYESNGKELMRAIERSLTLATIDDSWKEHLREMDELKQSVQNAVYEQKDPLLIYKFESFELFNVMLTKISKDLLSFLTHGRIPLAQDNLEEAQAPKKSDNSNLKTGRNSDIPGSEEQSRYHDPSAGNKSSDPVRVEKKVGRNDPCPCGSGKKYKQCHGK
ncbi:MAG: preprotein translocase subunit SecA [Marinilabiliales bacterium]|nr:MAG: preprotein translocase subunit SecA [Marinilabiliales bacterium]